MLQTANVTQALLLPPQQRPQRLGGWVGGGGGEEMGSKNINKKTLRLGGEAYKSTLQVNQLRILSDRLMKYTASNWTLVNKRRGGGEMGRMGDGG